MSQFLQLPQQLREKIITKLEWKSYFRMQQTCHYMADLFRTNRNIKICLPSNIVLDMIKQDKQDLFVDDTEYAAEFESLYGVRFCRLVIRQESKRTFPAYCNNLFKKYRITSKSLDTYTYCNREQYGEILGALKPEEVGYIELGSNGFEALLNVQGVKDVQLNLIIDDLQDMGILEKFLTKFRVLYVSMGIDADDPWYDVTISLLQYLRRTPLPYLHSFHLQLSDGEAPQLISLEELLQLFADVNPVLLKTNDYEDYDKYEIECRLGHSDRQCLLKIGRFCVDLSFKFVDANQ